MRYVSLPVVIVMATTMVGCSDLLDVEDPTVAAPGTVRTEAAVPTSLNAALSAMQLAFSGAPGAGSFIDSQVTISGMLSDEFHVSESFPTRIDVDQRRTTLENGTMLGAFARLQTARRLAEFSAALHAEFESTAHTAGHAHAHNLAGFSYILFGENYCSGVPFSNVAADGSLDFGPPIMTEGIFDLALAAFAEALAAAQAAGNMEQQNLARLGLARALLNLDRAAEAAAAASAVPTSFVYRIFHSLGSPRQQNGIWGGNQNRRGISVSDQEGGSGLPFRSAGDPRVPWTQGTIGFDNTTPLFLQQKYPAQGSHAILASGVEARLIEAEYGLRSGGDWLAALNGLRAAPPAYYPATQYPGIDGLAPLLDPGAADSRVDLLFRERAFWLWLTAHRTGDLRRLMRQYGRSDVEAGWPSGSYFRGDAYGRDVSMPVPFDELNNPLFRDHFGGNGCDPTVP